ALKRGASPECVHRLCDQALEIFLRYHMQRAAEKVKDLRKGVAELRGQPSLPSYERLTRRELEVLCLVADGHTDREVAEVLVISPRTVNRHLSNIFVKLDVPGRAAAVAYAIRNSLV
ncbi:MAG: helix-turn-helix transcriptional regulator, partial [Ktedonobacteraceae bacterium]|nr:helix-turn-helix transcriptional regulator [Ktedonobacteraceae bacterium]